MLFKCLDCHEKFIPMPKSLTDASKGNDENWWLCPECGIFLYEYWTTENIMEHYFIKRALENHISI